MTTGYGQFNGVGNRHWLAHRLIWHLSGRPEFPHLHHRCGIKPCVNPTHLEGHYPASHARRHAADRTHCKWGHAFDEKNTYWRMGRAGVRTRQCRKCKVRAMQRAWGKKTAEERAAFMAWSSERRRQRKAGL